MKMNPKILMVAGTTLALTAIGAPQFKSILKLIGVGAAVKQFGPEINKTMNKLVKHTDTFDMTTKVVPIVTLGINGRNGIGAAQVMGPKDKVDQVKAVAQLDQDLFGREVKIRAMIPIATTNPADGLNRVPGVGVSGVVDIKL